MSCEDAKATTSFVPQCQPKRTAPSWEDTIPLEIRVKVWKIYLDGYFNASGFPKHIYNLNHNHEGYLPLSGYWRISKTTFSDIEFCIKVPPINTPTSTVSDGDPTKSRVPEILEHINTLSRIPHGKLIPYIPQIFDIGSLESYRGSVDFLQISESIKATGVLGTRAVRRFLETSQSHQLKSFDIHGPAIGHVDTTTSSSGFCSLCTLEMLAKHSPCIESIRIRIAGNQHSQNMDHCEANLATMKSATKLKKLEMSLLLKFLRVGQDIYNILSAPNLMEASFYKDGFETTRMDVELVKPLQAKFAAYFKKFEVRFQTDDPFHVRLDRSSPIVQKSGITE